MSNRTSLSESRRKKPNRKKEKSMSDDFGESKNENAWNVVGRKKSLSFSGVVKRGRKKKKKKSKNKKKVLITKEENESMQESMRERLWLKLFNKLNQSIDDVYDMVRLVSTSRLDAENRSLCSPIM